MRNLLYPREEYDSVRVIPFDKLYKQGFRGIIFDIDNTLVRHGASATTEVVEFIGKLKEMGYSAVLLSNNHEERVESFAKAVGLQYEFDANKPMRKGYLGACAKMGLDPGKVIFVGDQIYTDVLGANLSGTYSIIVKPIHNDPELQIRFKRLLEKPVLFMFRRSIGKKRKRKNQQKNHDKNHK